MSNDEIFEVETSENVEEITTEQIEDGAKEPEKIYSEEDFNQKLNEVIGKRLARNEAKIRKEYDKKYGKLEKVLKAGTGEDDVEKIADVFTNFYEEKGVEIPKEPVFSKKEMEVLARAEASEIIEAGFEEVVEEAQRLKDLGVKNMSEREREVFLKLTEHIKNTEAIRELSRIGVSKDVYGSKEFEEFASKFSSKTPVTEIYNIYCKTKPKKEIQTAGSVTQTVNDKRQVKDFYTREEALKFSREDFDKNPDLFKAVENSMLKW